MTFLRPTVLLFATMLGACVHYVPLHSGFRIAGDEPENKGGYYGEYTYYPVLFGLAGPSYSTGRIVLCNATAGSCSIVFPNRVLTPQPSGTSAPQPPVTSTPVTPTTPGCTEEKIENGTRFCKIGPNWYRVEPK